jgi:hypothetical protein
MSDFVTTVFRGLYPPFLFFFVWGVVTKIWERKWHKFDTLLLAAFLIFELLAASQVWLFYGELSTSKRYMWIAVPLYLPFAARGALGIWSLLKKSYKGRIFAFLATAALVATTVHNFYMPVTKEQSSSKRRYLRRLSLKTATAIHKTWTPPPDAARLTDLRYMRCDQYQSGKRPLVQTDWLRVGYLSGGQTYPEFFRDLNIPPDYIVVMNNGKNFPGYIRIAMFPGDSGGKYVVYIYKRKGLP